jgi:copper chaperone CopZ
MQSRSAFHLDCTPVIPECGFQCPKCVQEIESVLTGMKGVTKVYLEDEATDGKLIVEHDPTMVTVEQLIDTLKGLPSFYEGFFAPIMIT